MYFKYLLSVILLGLLSVQHVYGQDKAKDTVQSDYVIIRTFSISYPKKAEENNIAGTVVVQYDMDSTCSFVNIKIIKSLGYGCDEEVVKAIRGSKVLYKGRRKTNCEPQYNIVQTFTFAKPEEE